MESLVQKSSVPVVYNKNKVRLSTSMSVRSVGFVLTVHSVAGK